MVKIFYTMFCMVTFLSCICYVYMVEDRIRYENIKVKYKSSKSTNLLAILIVLMLSIMPIINILLFFGTIESIYKLNELTIDELKEKFKLKEC